MSLQDEVSVTSDFAGHRRISPEQRMNEFHTERRTGPVTHSFEERVVKTAAPDSGDNATLKAARAEAVEYVVKAFAAVDKNIALADKARLQQEKTRAAAEKLRLEAEQDLAGARRMKEQAERELADARARCETLIAEARVKGDQLLHDARTRCKAEVEAARRELASTLLPLRELVGQAGSTIDALVEKNAVEVACTDEDAIDVRDDSVREAETARRYMLVSPVPAD